MSTRKAVERILGPRLRHNIDIKVGRWGTFGLVPCNCGPRISDLLAPLSPQSKPNISLHLKISKKLNLSTQVVVLAMSIIIEYFETVARFIYIDQLKRRVDL